LGSYALTVALMGGGEIWHGQISPHRCNVWPLRGEKPQNRAMLPANTHCSLRVRPQGPSFHINGTGPKRVNNGIVTTRDHWTTRAQCACLLPKRDGFNILRLRFFPKSSGAQSQWPMSGFPQFFPLLFSFSSKVGVASWTRKKKVFLLIDCG